MKNFCVDIIWNIIQDRDHKNYKDTIVPVGSSASLIKDYCQKLNVSIGKWRFDQLATASSSTAP